LRVIVGRSVGTIMGIDERLKWELYNSLRCPDMKRRNGWRIFFDLETSCFPAGLYSAVYYIAESLGYEVQLEYNYDEPVSMGMMLPQLRGYQADAVRAMLPYRRGLLQSSPKRTGNIHRDGADRSTCMSRSASSRVV